MRRRLGAAPIRQNAARSEALSRKGAQITAESARQMKQQLESFKKQLEQFAIAHRKAIQSDPAFRAQFHGMCASIGVDPLTSRKGVWAEMLGVGDYYYELGVRVIEVCVATRPMNGGIISLREVVETLGKRRLTYTEKISSDDVERAVSKLAALSSGFKIVVVGTEKMVQSVPTELSIDHTKALAICGDKGYTTQRELMEKTGWPAHRANTTLQYLLCHEFAWLDKQAGEDAYWIVGMVSGMSGDT